MDYIFLGFIWSNFLIHLLMFHQNFVLCVSSIAFDHLLRNPFYLFLMSCSLELVAYKSSLKLTLLLLSKKLIVIGLEYLCPRTQ